MIAIHGRAIAGKQKQGTCPPPLPIREKAEDDVFLTWCGYAFRAVLPLKLHAETDHSSSHPSAVCEALNRCSVTGCSPVIEGPSPR